MALFATLPAGSGKFTPLFPNLVLRWSVDGMGLVFEDPSSNFLLVWNGEFVDQAIEYAPGLFTQVLPRYTGELVRPGPTAPSFTDYPFGLGFRFEIERYPTGNSGYAFPASFNGSQGGPTYHRDRAYSTHDTGDTRRFLTWPPLRSMVRVFARVSGATWASWLCG